MYLHLGQDKVVSMDEIVGIFDLDYLAKAEKDGCVTNVCTDLPKSFIVCIGRDQKTHVYISQISSSTLLKRTEYVDSLSNI